MTTLLAGQVSVRAIPEARVRPERRRSVLGLDTMMRLHEALLGRRTFSILGYLVQSAGGAARTLRQMQLAKLRRLVAHAAEHSAYYRDLGLPDAGDILALQDVRAIPLLSRSTLREQAGHMRWQNMPGKQMVDHSRGTTEEPIAYYWDRHRQAWDKANRLRGHGWNGFFPGHRELHFWPVDPPLTPSAKLKAWLRQRRDGLFAEFQIDSLNAFKNELPYSWRAWRRFDPQCVTAYPSALARFIQDGRRVGCHMRSASLRGVFLTGEVTFDWQRRLIEQALGVPTIQDYGVQEVGAIAYSCPQGGWHIAAESALVEIVREGRPARAGELGEVVVTGLESRAMPVLRYCTGDIVRLGEAACDCGLALPVIPPVLGRAADFLESEGGTWIEPARVVASLGQVLEDGSFQVSQAADGRVEVAVVGLSAVRGRAATEARIRACVAELIGSRWTCTVHSVSDLQHSLFGKCRYVFSERTKRGLAMPTQRVVRSHAKRDTLSVWSGEAGNGAERSAAG